MYRCFAVALFFLVSCALARNYQLTVHPGKGCPKTFNTSKRLCVCLKNTSTHYIKNYTAGKLLLFSSSDCTGNYSVLKEGQLTANAEWINSASFGPNSGSSAGPYGCPNYIPKNC